MGGGDWKGAADIKGDWSEWRVKLDPHLESGNSTIYARLVVSEDSISPVDARRVILVDGDASDAMSGDFMQFGLSVFLFPFLCAVALISFVALRERWDKKIDLSTKSSDSTSKFRKTLEAVNPLHYPGYLGSAVESWKGGSHLPRTNSEGMSHFLSCTLPKDFHRDSPTWRFLHSWLLTMSVQSP